MSNKPKHPTIAMSGVKSSQIESIGHDAATNTLAVKFKGSGGTYHYEGVTAKDFTTLNAAESVGKHFGANVRGKFKHTRINNQEV